MKTINKYIIPAATLLLLGACNDNAWNDHLDGFQQPEAGAGINNAVYTLTTDDYKTLASLEANIAIAESDGESEALEAIGKNATFESEEQAVKYLPALLATTNKNLPYFTYNNGSAVKLTYNVSGNLSDVVKGINASTLTYTVTENNYKEVWDSNEDYINAFAPANPAAASLPLILLDGLNGQAGDYAVATYNEASVNPVFTTPDTPNTPDTPITPPAPTWSETSVISTLTKGETAEIHGIVTAITTRGFILTDNSGSILCYQSSGFDATAIPLYSQLIVKGTVDVYNQGLQIPITSESYENCGIGTYTYPAPTKITGSEMDAAIANTSDFLPKYVQFEGELTIRDDKYYNIEVSGATLAIGSGYYVPDYIKTQLETGKTYTFAGYFMAISGGKYYNIVITQIGAPGTNFRGLRISRAPAADVEVAVKNALYQFNGTSWTAVSDVVVLNPSDYTSMGLSYANLSGKQPDEYLPIFLKQKFPYAAAGDIKTIAFAYYANQQTSYVAHEYVLTEAGEWKINAGETTSQFVKSDGEWKYNPSVVIDLPYARNTEPSYTYYMACIEWVYENICVPMGDTSLTSGKFFIDYRGNAEYWSGASAFYGNVDIRATTALQHVPDGYTGYDGLDNDEIEMLIKKRFSTETLPGALAKLHPDADAVKDMEVTYTVNLSAYTGSQLLVTLVYDVVGKGEFKYKSSTWVSEEVSESWKEQ